MLFGQPDQLKQYLLLYDELWVPSLQQSYPSSEEIREWDLDEEHLASLQWLEAQGLLRESPIALKPEKIAGDEVTAGLLELHDFASARGGMTWETAEEAALEGAAAATSFLRATECTVQPCSVDCTTSTGWRTSPRKHERSCFHHSRPIVHGVTANHHR